MSYPSPNRVVAARYFVNGVNSTHLRQLRLAQQLAAPQGDDAGHRTGVEPGHVAAAPVASPPGASPIDDDDDDDGGEDDIDLEGYLQEMEDSSDDEDLSALIRKFKSADIATNKSSRRHTPLECQILSKMRDFTLRTLRISRIPGPCGTVKFSNFPESPSFPDQEIPTLERATVAWDSPPTHEYNRRLHQLLAYALVFGSDCSPLFGPDPDQDVLIKMANQIRKYLKYLRKIRTRQLLDARLTTPGAREQAALDKLIKRDIGRANKRRAGLHKRRMDTCARFERPHWIALLKHVRPLSMSSDDPATDAENGAEQRYYVTLKNWRSADFIEFLRLIDLLSGVIARQGEQERGRVFRNRRPTPPEKGVRTSTREPTPKLNKEFYSEEQQKVHGSYYRYARVTGFDLRTILVEARELAVAQGVFIG